MISITGISGREVNATMDLVGLSTDEKPVGKFIGNIIQNGSTFFEMDTSRMYVYDANNLRWFECAYSGSGGAHVPDDDAQLRSAIEALTGRVTVIEGGAALKEDLSQKITSPENPTEGKILRVLSVNEDGTFTCEWGDVPNGGGVTDVRVDGKSVVENEIAVIPNATSNTKGVVSTDSAGGTYCSDGKILTCPASQYYIDRRVAAKDPTEYSRAANYYRPIVPALIDYSVKAALCDGKGDEWTFEERQAAQTRIGILSTEGVEF